MACAPDRNPQSVVRIHVVVNCLNIRLDVAADRIGGTVVVGQKEHEWPTQTRLNHAAERLTIDVNARPASRIIMAKLRCYRAS